MRGRFVEIAAIACLITLASRAASASNVAFDTAGDSAYNNGWTAGSSGGYGWGGGWSVSSGDGAAALVADPNASGEINSPAGPGGRSWAVSGDLTISRQFAGGMQIGQTFSIDVDQAPVGEFGTGIVFGDVFDHVSIADNGGSTYDLLTEHSNTGVITTVHTNISVVNGPIQITFTRADAENYIIGVTPLSPGATTSTVSASYSGDGSDGFGLGGEDAPLHFNNIALTPEPSTLCLGGLATLGLLRRRPQSSRARR